MRGFDCIAGVGLDGGLPQSCGFPPTDLTSGFIGFSAVHPTGISAELISTPKGIIVGLGILVRSFNCRNRAAASQY